MSLTRGWPHHLRRAASIMLWVILLLAIAAAINVLGIHLAGGIEGWRQWLADHAGHFLVWRLLLYAGTAWGWIWMRRRVLAREPGARQRLLRAEIAAVVAVATLEISQMTGG
ncbi:hypothetical protein L1F06_013020 [Ectopseudomonas hydrolytica]|uniref:Uncharacterized protein n=1 Tax=Ectopseudomonas hydrolytica TaxID=2493633 RepID=A0ABY5A1I8_9GAMM|nr:hypothetical protein [Pseudomonas hydrolytica]OCX15334.1 hypothetical protein BBI09_16295 [Stutzerimonas xanthomarina]USR37617.1 hypothetical protein L1F06_013020 [Pseudomonas hydrolytica]